MIYAVVVVLEPEYFQGYFFKLLIVGNAEYVGRWNQWELFLAKVIILKTNPDRILFLVGVKDNSVLFLNYFLTNLEVIVLPSPVCTVTIYIPFL